MLGIQVFGIQMVTVYHNGLKKNFGGILKIAQNLESLTTVQGRL